MFTKRCIVALMFASILVCGALQAAGNPAKGKELSANCVDCHGKDGKGVDDAPAIAGLNEMKHFEALKAFKSGTGVKEDDVMPMFTEDLSEQDMADLAAYYA